MSAAAPEDAPAARRCIMHACWRMATAVAAAAAAGAAGTSIRKVCHSCFAAAQHVYQTWTCTIYSFLGSVDQTGIHHGIAFNSVMMIAAGCTCSMTC